MKKKYPGLGLIALLILLLAACGDKNEATEPVNATAAEENTTENNSVEEKKEDTTNEPRSINYLGQDYAVPAKTEKIVITGSLEAMEDALVLGVEPVGGITIGGEFPDMFAEITDSTESIGEKAQPNMETILKLKPDVILGTTKFPADVSDKLVKFAPTIPISTISTDWEENLRLLAELTGKQEKAEQVLQKYKDDAAAAKEQLSEQLRDKKVVIVRIRGGNIMIYRDDVFFNPSLYKDLGLTVPEQVKAAKTQEMISLEKFSEINPDYLFVQFSVDENKDQPKALEELQTNPIWQSIKAVNNDKVFVNVVDPLAQGGTAWSKINFLEAAVEKLSNE
ncbi:ABC transporter substrate-binding protein [Metabacillus arenae]|uniref:ABC transporter substrate-binding protein n=1 Tax=Metabacillus arenae TaxID=2771434 RepID=A0A926RZH4_9BACI|nr:ABC transporter substrate-binding protein [Metabacillus arenae]MBD1382820.1 ABC transporter substrate-binding protein [Metabacillus arenae]